VARRVTRQLSSGVEGDMLRLKRGTRLNAKTLTQLMHAPSVTFKVWETQNRRLELVIYSTSTAPGLMVVGILVWEPIV
jgi:hypothetical protein